MGSLDSPVSPSHTNSLDAPLQPVTQPPPPPPHSQNPLPPLPLQETNRQNEIKPQVARKPLPLSKPDVDGLVVQDSPLTAVRVHPPPGQDDQLSFSAPIEDHGSQISPGHSRATSGTQSIGGMLSASEGTRQPTPLSLPTYSASQDQNSSSASPQDGNGSNRLAEPRSPIYSNSKHTPPESVADDSQFFENFEPLQYHHQFQENGNSRALDKRMSKLTIRSTTSDRTSSSDGHLAPAHARDPAARRSLPRPDSAFSSGSDLGRGRTRSPQLTPGSYTRARSAHSMVSPDVRPMSYVDLLNVPYPQPSPLSPGDLDNSGLRRVVGNNAELLSSRKTLEMYRANVKKTNDPAIAYEFAVFMISAAQDPNLDENMSNSALSDKSQGTSQEGLLKEAKQILQKLSDRSYPFAQYYLADGYGSGLFSKGKEDYDKAFPLFISASKHGHAEAGYRAALCYEFGWGSKMDAAKAVQFYRQAASKNHPGAMLRLGRACLAGDLGLGQRYREGVKWLKRGAESADFQYNSAPYELGVLHETGYGDDIFKDESYAAQLFTKSADLGHAEASYRLGDAYEHGKLTCPHDPALSVHFYTGAAQRGHPLAMMALCAWYMVGAEPVLDKDENEAYEWARKAAEEGLCPFQFSLLKQVLPLPFHRLRSPLTYHTSRPPQSRIRGRILHRDGHRLSTRPA